MHYDLNSHTPHQRLHREAVEAGFSALGFEDRNLVVSWGWRGGKRHYARGKDVLVLERGYIGDRFKFSSVGLNGLNGRATFGDVPDDGGERFPKFGVPIKPWNPAGEYVLLIGQVRGDASLQGRDLTPWYVDTARQAAALYGLPVRFRQHPRERERRIIRKVPGTVADNGSLEEALAGAAVVVTYNSNTGVDSMLAGKPTVVFDSGAMAWPVAGKALGEESNPDRQSWAYGLAWKQWAVEEIASGAALKGIAEVLNGSHRDSRGSGRDHPKATAITRTPWPQRRSARAA